MKKITVILMALLLVLTMIACVDNGNGEESPSETKKPVPSASEPNGEDDPIDESSTPVDNESIPATDPSESSDTEPVASEKDPETPAATPAPTKPETTKNNSGVIELPRDTF